MPNNLAQYQKVADRVLYILETQLAFSSKVNMSYGKEYENQKFGPTLQVERPSRYTVRTGDAVALQGITQPTVLLTVQPVFGVDVPIGSSEMALILGSNFRDWDRKVGMPAASQLATAFEQNIAALNNLFYNFIGVPGTAPATLAVLLACQQRLNEENVPMADRAGVVGPASSAALVNGLTGNFVRPVIDPAEVKGSLDFTIAGLENGLAMSQVAPSHTCGTMGGAPTITVANQQGTSFLTTGWTAGSTLNPGDVITFAGVNAVNPQTRNSTGALRQFVVAALATADAAGNATITTLNPLNPPIGGIAQQFQTVDATPAAGAVVAVVTAGAAFARSGLTQQENMIFQRDAMLVVTLPQPIFPGAYYCEQREYNGIAFRVWLDGDIRNNQAIMRLDILAAFGVGNREALVRLTA